MNRPLFVFAFIFFTTIMVDAVKFLLAGKPTVVNWESFIHPAWVIGAVLMLFLAARFPLVHCIAFGLYLCIFVLAYLDIYLDLSETLTYFCMLFNLVIVTTLFFTYASALDKEPKQ